MITSTLARLALLALVPLPLLVAQDPAAPPLVVKTCEARFVRSFGQPPAGLDANEHYVVTMAADGEFEVTRGQGKVPLVAVEARPRLLLEIFADEADEARRVAKATASVGAASAGMRPGFIAGMVDAIFDFPQQIDLLTLTVDGDEEKGFAAHAEVSPLAGSAFELGMRNVRPSERGVPQLDDGAVTLRCDLHPSVVKDVFLGLSGLVASMVDEADRPAVQKLTATQAGASDGTMAFVMGAGGIITVFGCADAGAMHQLMAGGEWERMQRAFIANMPDAEVTTEREKVGDLDVLHTHGDLGTIANPFAKDGKLEGWATVAGDMLISVANGGRKVFDDLVAGAVAGKTKRAPLPGGSVLTMHFAVEEMLTMQGRDAPRGAPATVDLSLGKKAKSTLVLDVRVGM